MQCTMTTGGRGIDAERARAAADAGPAERQRLDRRQRGDARSAARRAGLVPRRAATAPANLRAAGVARRRSTRRSTACRCASCPTCSRRSSRTARHAWQIQLTVAMGRAADEPDVLLQPYDLLELFPLLARLQGALRRGRRACSGRATTSATSAPTRRLLRGDAAARPHGARAARAARRSASRPTAPSRAARRCRRSPGRAATSATPRCRTSGSAPRRCASRAIAPSTICGATAATCYYADVCRAGCTWTAFVAVRQAGQQPVLPPPRARDAARAGKRERLVQVERAPGVPFDHGRFEIVVEEIAT